MESLKALKKTKNIKALIEMTRSYIKYIYSTHPINIKHICRTKNVCFPPLCNVKEGFVIISGGT